MPLKNIGQIPGIRSGQLPPPDYPSHVPAIGLRLQEQGFACGVSVDGHWLPCSHVQLDVAASGAPQVVVTIPALDLTIETETQRVLPDAA